MINDVTSRCESRALMLAFALALQSSVFAADSAPAVATPVARPVAPPVSSPVTPPATEFIVPFRAVAANLPPLSVANRPAAPGILVELTEAMAARLGQSVHVEFYPWTRAIALAQAEPRVVVLALMRTTEREAKYQWLVKMYQQQYVFLTRADAPPVQSMDEARKLKRIGVLRGAASGDFLQDQHIPKSVLLESATTAASLKDLDAGFVDAYCCSVAVCGETILQSHHNLADYHFGAKLAGADIWLAASGGFSQDEVRAMRKAFDTLVKNGTLARLQKKYRFPQ